MSEQNQSTMGFLLFDEKPAQASPAASNAPWKILVVDDDDQVQAVTRMVLRHVQFRDRSFMLIPALSGQQARAVLQSEQDIALALIDVVMETKTAGLDLVRHIREELKDRSMRLIMRTGQPGHAPEQSVVIDYEIDAYMAKTDLSAQKLVTTIIASLRAFEYISEIRALNAELEARVAMRTEELEKLAMLDALTGAGNRRHLEQRAQAEIAFCEREGMPLSVVMFDLDHFKKINDSWGHAAGDLVLQKVVNLAKDLLRPSDFLARIGGEEFVILLPAVNSESAAVVAERIRQAFEASQLPMNGNILRFTSSFGLTMMTPGETLETVLARADSALYKAKHAGRNQVCQLS
ncbi:diguanylate cyclase [Massilia sp. W12]|uniref:GGDEF domain-containing response regulator n=1 Tax=Massilia sp. W12 TaxID=3126507 RepID=UPI0030D609EA